MRSRTTVTLCSSVLVLGALYACSSDPSDSPGGGNEAGAETGKPDTGGGSDTSTNSDTGTDSSQVDAGVDAADAADGFDGNTEKPIRCSQAQFDAVAGNAGGDYTGNASVTITFPTGPTPAQYTNRCIKVNKDTVVTFTGSFASHPLQAFGGTEPSSIPATSMGTTLDVTMDTLGNYGYQCVFHPGSMFGAIQVVP